MLRRFGSGASCVLAALALGWACVRNPATGRRQLSLIGEGQEIQMGKEYDPQVAATMGLYADSALQRYAAELGTRLAAASERPSLPWTFRVVDDPVVNAFALPGGFIYVTRGILAHFESEAELAAVLGHEIGHVTARHSVSQLSRQQLAQLGLAVGSVLSPEVQRFSGLASAALGVLFLKHSRDAEREADELGLRYMRRGGYDPREMPDVFTMLERVSAGQSGGRTPEWLATHPNPENRRARIEQQLAALPPDSLRGLVRREAYLRRIDGIVFGVNPREGFFRGSEFLHPDLRFRVRFPEGWTTANQKQAVMAVSPERDAMFQVGLAEQATPDAAARAFFGRTGITSGGVSRAPVNGLRAVTGSFAAETESGTLRGAASFIELGERVYQLLAYAPAARWSAHASAAERFLESFAELTERAALDVQPWRVDVITVERRTTLQDLARERPSPVPVGTLALLNQIAVDATLAQGQVIKWVVGRPLP
ncbi:MAG TPA: M48 family metalloprotease [Gemmatimonadales bacterium]